MSVHDDNPFIEPDVPEIGTGGTTVIEGPFGIRYDPNSVNYGQIPSDLIRDELSLIHI